MRRLIAYIVALHVCALAAVPKYSHGIELPEDALGLIAQTTTDPCPICVEQKLNEAFAVMAARLQPGMALETRGDCRLRKADPGEGFELVPTCYPSEALARSTGDGRRLPDVAFVFYPSGRRMVGVSDSDVTDERIADAYRAAPPGAVFEGRVKLIPYRYGDGPAFTYFPRTNRVRIHCVVLELRPLTR